MARAKVSTDKSKLVIDCTKSIGKGMVVQVITGGISVYFAFGNEGARELETNNANGISDGFVLTSLNQPMIFEHFADVLYAIVPPGGGAAEVFAMDFQARQPGQRKTTISQQSGWIRRATAAALSAR